MNVDTNALRALAAAQKVDPLDVFAAIQDALNTAYQGTDDADPDARVCLDDDGTIRVTDPNGVVLPVPGFSRGAAATARQAVVSWVKDLERRKAVGPWATREGRALQATVAASGRAGELRLTIDGQVAILPTGEQIAGERLNPGMTTTVLLLAANVDAKDNIRLSVSRRQPALVERLIADQCPEVRAGDIEVTGVVREPGVRAKVALRSNVPGLDPVAAVVGAGGHRMLPVTAALGAERVDLVRYDENIAAFAAHAITPVHAVSATVLDPARRQVQVVVPADQLAAAHGADGLNLKLASRLTRTKIVLALAD